MKSKILSLIFLFIITSSFGQDGNSEIIKNLNKIVKPIHVLAPADDFNDINFLKTEINDATIIGLGEGAHGVKAFDNYKRRLTRFFVSEMGFKAIVYEGDILAGERIDDYINSLTDTLEIIGSFPPTAINKAELDWLRNFNKSVNEKQKVHIYGAEVRDFYNLANKLISLIPNLTEQDKNILVSFTKEPGIGFSNFSKNDFNNLKSTINRLSLMDIGTKANYYLMLLKQIHDFAYSDRFTRSSFGKRDNYMLQNIQSIINKTPGNKVLISAHNGHLQKTRFCNFKSLGFLLNNANKDKYYVLATDFNEGSVTVFDEKSKDFQPKYFDTVNDKDAIEYYFKQSNYDNFIFPVKTAAKESSLQFLTNKKIRTLRNMGSTGVVITCPIRVAENYDLVVFIRNINKK